jgi:transposase-like protein
MEDFDYKAMEALAPEQLKSGKPLFGKGGAFAPLLEKILNAAPESEMDAHMDCEERSLGNRRNGYTSKQVQTGMGEVGVHTPRDRDSRFEPEFIKKRERVLADSVSDRIIGLYALGNSTRGIRGIGKVGLSGLSQHQKEMDNAPFKLGTNCSTIGY